MVNFLKTAVNEHRKHRGEKELTAGEFLKLMREKWNGRLTRPVDQPIGKRRFFRRREKEKRNFPDGFLEPKLAILDETDSGLDIDALKTVAHGVNALRKPDNATIVVTHYQRLLDYIIPDHVHVLYQGKIAKSGGRELAFELEEKGYDWLNR
jgi:Fe-S cluster assembly ATP-binding protein